MERAVLAEARRTFAPEFLNRLDGTLVFHPLDGDSLAAITRQLLDQTGERLSALGVSLQVEEDAVRLLARAGSDRDYGARPLRRYLQHTVETLISRKIVSDQVEPGSRITVECRDGELTVDSREVLTGEVVDG